MQQGLSGGYATNAIVALYLLATAVCTAAWMDGKPPSRVMAWEGARLLLGGLLLVMSWSTLATGLFNLLAVAYLLTNLFLVKQLPGRRVDGRDPSAQLSPS